MCDLTSNYQDGSYDVISRHESAAAWRVNTKHLPAYAEAPASFWSIFNFTFSHSLEFSDQNIKIRQFSTVVYKSYWSTTNEARRRLYVLPHQRLWTFDVLVCPLSVTERFLLQPLVCGTVFHHTSLLPPLSPSSAVVLNHISSHFLIPLSDSSFICTVPAQWPVILDTMFVITFNILTFKNISHPRISWKLFSFVWSDKLQLV